MVLLVRENRIVIDDMALLPRHIWESYSGGNGTNDSWDSLSQGIAYLKNTQITISNDALYYQNQTNTTRRMQKLANDNLV